MEVMFSVGRLLEKMNRLMEVIRAVLRIHNHGSHKIEDPVLKYNPPVPSVPAKCNLLHSGHSDPAPTSTPSTGCPSFLSCG
jgi:hypothetical protein